jgi:RNA polymerase II subunit A small phosphatase-like protein
LIRPYLYDFLAALEPYYELGIFTCSLPEYADIIIDHMKQIKFRLYRHHTVRISGEYVKDLSRIGRNLSTLLMIDNIEINYRLQPDNGILIRSWYGDKKDTMLKQISKMLIELAKSEPEDIRRSDFIRSFN